MSTMDLGRIELARRGSALAHHLVIRRCIGSNRCVRSIALAARRAAVSARLSHHRPKPSMIDRRDDAESRRGKGRGAEERHRDCILDRWRARQSRHGEG